MKLLLYLFGNKPRLGIVFFLTNHVSLTGPIIAADLVAAVTL